MDDEVVTHGAVLSGLSPDIRRALLLALPPEKRGWWTAEEMRADDSYEWIEIVNLNSRDRRYIPGRRRS